jgi:hypothetical protein
MSITSVYTSMLFTFLIGDKLSSTKVPGNSQKQLKTEVTKLITGGNKHLSFYLTVFVRDV